MTLSTGEVELVPTSGIMIEPGTDAPVDIHIDHAALEGDGPIKLEVRGLNQLGGYSYIYGALLDDPPVTVDLSGQVTAEIGEIITIAARSDEIHLFDTEIGFSLRIK